MKEPQEVLVDDLRATPSRLAISEYLAELGRKGGKKGGKARAEKLSAKRRKEIAKKAAKARWSKNKKPKS
jgi:hypothetical protein